MTAQNVVPFGKYKGRDILEVLEDDPGYLQWLAGQDWFRAKYITLHQTIISRGAEPEETPEHNALQVMFLDDEFCRRFISHIYPGIEQEAQEEIELGRRHRLAYLIGSKCPEYYSSDRFWYTQLKDKRIEADRISTPVNEVSFLFGREFEEAGIDVTLNVTLVSPIFDDLLFRRGKLCIEIKPTVGDDYPAVLRQMKRNESKVLFLKSYTGQGATREQFIKTFETADFRVVFLDEVV